MRPRHRIPSVFTLSLVDVLCGFLGCVILLWQVNARKVEESSLLDDQKDDELRSLRQEQQSLSAALKGLRDEEEKLRRLLALARTDDSSSKERVARLESRLATVGEEKATLGRLLARRIKELEDLQKQSAGLARENERLAGELKTQSALAAETKARADDLDRKLKAAAASIRELEATAALVPRLRDDIKGYRDKAALDEKTAKALQTEIDKRLKELADVNKRVDELLLARRALERDLEGKDRSLAAAMGYKDKLTEAEKKYLALQTLLDQRARDLLESGKLVDELKDERKRLLSEAGRLRAVVENRFAGIALTGRRVVFLVDMSGSMDLLDPRTEAPGKWQGVRETLARVMRSLTALDKFQIILFSEDVKFPLGQDGQWIDYDPRTSPDRVLEALAKIKPVGGTNMYRAMDTTFRYRRLGLDTIYLFSDGLPNEGEGLTFEQRTIRDETLRSTLLARHIRRKLKEEWNRPDQGQPPVKINGVGFFFESPDVGAFLWALSRENDGSFVGMSKP